MIRFHQSLRAFLYVMLALLACSPKAFAQPKVKHVFIVSFDGGKPSVMQESVMPTLMAMRKEGAGTWEAFTVVPSVTLVSHTSMLTGVQPDKHLIDWNDWKPEKGLVQVPTIFGLARAKGLTTALFAGKEKFKHLNVPGTLDAFSIPSYDAKTVAQVAAKYIQELKPNLCFIHFADSDGAGHEFGWGTEEQKKAFADEDEALLTLQSAIEKAGIQKESVIILTADHGGHDKTHGSTQLADMHIPWIVWGAGVRKDFTIPSRVSTCDTAATALWLLRVPLPDSMDGKPVKSAFGK
jgi:arylsulfatase A-like enzyme